LKGHPDIFLPEQKQLYHFASDHNEHRKKYPRYNKKYYREYYNYSYETYIKRFSFNERYKIYGDITPDYFYSAEAPRNIFEYNKDAFVIALIREPISFLVSFHNQMVRSGNEKVLDVLSAIKLEKDRRKERIKQNKYCPESFFQYSSLISYQKYLSRYHKLFGDKFKVIIYEEFNQDNFFYLNEINKFLNINKHVYHDKVYANISGDAKSPKNSLRDMYFVRYLSSKIPWKLKNKVKMYLSHKLNKSMDNEELKSQIHREIRQLINPEILALEDYLMKNNLILGGRETNLRKIWAHD